MMTIPFAQTVNGLEFVLGEIAELAAHLFIRNEKVLIKETNREALMLVHDEILLDATL